MFTDYTQSVAYIALCLAVWGAGEGIGAVWDRAAARWVKRVNAVYRRHEDGA